MATGRDVRDMLGLPMAGDAQRTASKKKAAAPVRRIRKYTGILRKLIVLHKLAQS